MDKISLQDRRDFPLTTNSLAFMQAAYAALEKLGYIGGDNYIVSGCNVTGSSAASGYMFLKGILMPFVGGSIASNVQIVKTVTIINVDAGVREQTSYRAEFGVSAEPTNNVAWADIVRTDTIISLMSQITALGNRMMDAEEDILANAQDIQVNIDNIEANAVALAGKANDNLVYAARIYEDGTTSSSTKIEVFVNKGNFITNVEHTSGDEFRLHLAASNSNWMNDLEIQAVSALPSTSTVSRNVTFFFRDAAYISAFLIDTSGNAAANGSFWVRIYKWA